MVQEPAMHSCVTVEADGHSALPMTSDAVIHVAHDGGDMREGCNSKNISFQALSKVVPPSRLGTPRPVSMEPATLPQKQPSETCCRGMSAHMSRVTEHALCETLAVTLLLRCGRICAG